METSPGRRSRRVPSPEPGPLPADDTPTDPAGTPPARAAAEPDPGTPPACPAVEPEAAAPAATRRSSAPTDGPATGGATGRPGRSIDQPEGVVRPAGPAEGPGRRKDGAAPPTGIPGRTEPARGEPTTGPTPGTVPREPGRGHRRARHAAGAGTFPGRRRRADPTTGGRPATTRAGATPADHHPDATGDPPERSTRHRAVLVALGVAAAVSAAALVAGLLHWSPQPTDPARPLAPVEAERLAAMRVTNQRDVRAGVRVRIGTGRARAELVGWVDWARPLVYLDVGGPGAGVERGLVQATRSAMVVRPDPAAAPTPAAPPLVPPDDRWRLREPPAGHGVAAVRDLLLGLGTDRVDGAPAAARWKGRDTVDGIPVDIVQAPLPTSPPGPAAATAGPDSAAPSRPPRLWLDRDARLHRLEGWLPDNTPVTLELARTDRPTLRPVDALGGLPGLPRALADAELDRLARLPARLRAAGGATLALAAPVGPTANLRAAGWLSWTGSAAYLAVGEVDTPGRRTLLRWRSGKVARVEVPADGGAVEVPAAPPLPPPAGLAWPADRPPGDGLDRLLDAALRAGGAAVPTASALRLRGDRVAGHAVDVIEVRPGRAAQRYWIDRDGLLRRLELRTGPGTWAQLDLTPGRTPVLPTTHRSPGQTPR
ncbi:hypothetical protein [Micromonospora sp. SL4-19]|uniref:hypothetical protein n=1 Tax=Micromonospora sp. SL4-19 TaxID=3399129 RepID=UPI003A4DD54B